ncbi:imelysin family protein [Aquimarina algiphila]|uniref:Imelysin family protein n=1 Tax=Aquimarina algiphila TaxID=2047982 RepID=A0A554VH42_9FLAO|nr:imelysin family protein [Aquimarina algiphila]TSE06784.1 imelysin family protein [Aquimarina algiphila]
MKKIVYIIPILTLLYLVSCSSDDSSSGEGGTGGTDDNFDRVNLTTSWVNNLLSPATSDLKSKLETLNNSVTLFTDVPDATKLATVRADLFEAYKVWQHVEMFFYASGYSLDMNTYPTDVTKITENINSATPVDLNRTVLNPTQGLPAMDYLLNGLESTDNDIITRYGEAKYKNYLKLLSERMVTITTTALNDFETTKDSNINSVDNSISSYFSRQVNDFVQYTEKSFREAKIATPSGTRNREIFPTISVSTSPNFVESLYSPENSKILYLEAYDAIQDFYYGRSYTNNNTVGLQEYLQNLGTTILINGNETLLDDYIISLFGNIDAANNNITDNFYQQTQDYNPNFDAVFDAIQEFVVAVKSNAINAFNLTIDFVDSDGD